LESDPFVRQAILLGDRRPFIAALIVPERTNIAGELHKEESALTESEIATALQARIDQLNARLEQFEKIRKFAVMQNDFSDQVRTVTVFQKIKIDRKALEQRYQKEIEEIYGLAEEERA
jgi:long-chain acyl-CoA synthetase